MDETSTYGRSVASPDTLITDEMVTRACVRFWRENAYDKSLTLHEQSQRAMRLALEEVERDIAEAAHERRPWDG